jgi:hypothetical protein
LPNVDGTLKYQLPQDIGARVGVGPNDYLKNLETLLMLSGEARKGRWAVLTDIVWLDFSSERSHVSSIDFVQAGQNPVSSSLDSGTRSSLKGAAWTLSGSYRLMDGASGTPMRSGIPLSQSEGIDGLEPYRIHQRTERQPGISTLRQRFEAR